MAPANGLRSVLGLPLPPASQCLGPFHQRKGRKKQKKKLEEQVESLELHYNHKLESDAGLGEKESRGEAMSVSSWVGPEEQGTAVRLWGKNVAISFPGSPS